MDLRFGMTVTGSREVKAAARRFERAATRLQARLTGAIRGPARPTLQSVRAAWRGVDVTSTRGGGSSSGLRSRVAAATKTKPIPTGVSFYVEGTEVDPRYGRSLSYGLNGLGRWRHPTFGRSPWTQQSGQEVFGKTIRAAEPTWRAGLELVVTEVAREIEG